VYVVDFPRKNGHVILGFFSVLTKESGDSVPRTPWDFSLWACSTQGPALGDELPGGSYTRRLQGCIGARGASPQSSILRCNIDTLGCVDSTVNYSLKLVSYWHGILYPSALCRRRLLVNLDVFEILTPRFSLASEDLIVRKTPCFQRAEECFHRCIGMGLELHPMQSIEQVLADLAELFDGRLQVFDLVTAAECRPIRSGPATTHGSRQLYAPCGNKHSTRSGPRNRSCRSTALHIDRSMTQAY
jgi:hypothetical protein